MNFSSEINCIQSGTRLYVNEPVYSQSAQFCMKNFELGVNLVLHNKFTLFIVQQFVINNNLGFKQYSFDFIPNILDLLRKNYSCDKLECSAAG